MTPVQALVQQAATKYATVSPPTVKAPAPTGGALGPTPKLSTGGAPSLGASPAKLSTPALGGAAGPKPLVPQVSPYNKNDAFVGMDSSRGPVFSSATGHKYTPVMNNGELTNLNGYQVGAPVAEDFLTPADANNPRTFTPAAAPAPAQPQPTQTQPTQPAQTQPKPQATAAPAPRRPFDDDFSTSLQSAPKEQQPQIAQQAMQQHMQSLSPVEQKGLQDVHAGNDTPEAQQFSQQVDAKGQEVMKANVNAQAAAHPELAATPQGFGQMWNQASEAWNGMPQEAKWMVGLGVPMAAVGLMSSLFGGGGTGMGLLGLLGLGAAGLGGAAGGLFGQGAANMSADAMYNIGTFTGMMPEKADLSRLKGENPMAAMGNKPIGTREEVAKQIAEGKAQMGQLRQLMSLPVGDDAKMRLMQRLDPSLDTPEAVQQAYQNAGTMIQQYDDPESELNKKMQEGQNYADSTGVKGWAMENVGRHLPDWMTGKKGSANTPILNLIEKWAFNDMDAKELSDLKAEEAKGAPYRVEDARREHELETRQQAETPAPAPVGVKKVTVVACSKSAASASAGLWANIRAKKKRGEKPAKPGDKDYPDAKNWNKVTAISEKKSAAKPCSCGCGDTVTTCKCPATCACRKAGGSCYKEEKTAASSPAWQRSAGKNDEGGLNAKGRASYNKATGGHLKAPVTESDPSGERDKRQNSFCSRMCGMKRVNTGASTAKDPDSRINKSLRKWNCKCSAAEEFGAKLARCWKGYEPVPGAKSYSRGSCRPVGSKKTQKEMKQT